MSLMQHLIAMGGGGGGGGGVVTSGLVLHVDFGNAACYPGSGTAFTDLSGNGNNGTLTNGPTFSAANGGQIVFDGVNDYAAIAGGSTLAFGTGDFTLEVWFRLTATPSGYAQIWAISHGASGFDNYFLRFADGGFGNRLQFGVNSSAVNNCYNFNATKTSLLNQWVSVVHRRTAGQNQAFMNGVSVNLAQGTGTSYSISSFSGTNGSVSPQNHRLASNTDDSAFFPGNIAIKRAYNRALPDSELLQNFNADRARVGL